MHEIRSPVVADTAAMQRQGSVPQLCGRNPGYPDVNGHRLHVEALPGHAVSVSAKEFVAPWRAVAADDINLKIRIPERSSQVVEKVEDPRIIIVNFAGSMVPQVTVQARQGFLIVAFAIAIDDIQALPSVCVKKTQAVWTI